MWHELSQIPSSKQIFFCFFYFLKSITFQSGFQLWEQKKSSVAKSEWEDNCRRRKNHLLLWQKFLVQSLFLALEDFQDLRLLWQMFFLIWNAGITWESEYGSTHSHKLVYNVRKPSLKVFPNIKTELHIRSLITQFDLLD